MLFLKACPRCEGGLVQESDFYGAYAVCIQCGCRLADDQLERVLRFRRSGAGGRVAGGQRAGPERAAA